MLKKTHYFCLALLLFASQAIAQANQPTIQLSNSTLKDFFKEVESKLGYSFMYSNVDIDDSKTISIKGHSDNIVELLDEAFKNQAINYELAANNKIVLKKAARQYGSSSVAQNPTTVPIKGTVIDNLGEPLIGVAVQIKGTTVGTGTDLDGNFMLVAPNNKSILIFSLVGYKTKEVAVGSETTINITMEEDLQLLDEVVVVGYGTQRRGSITGSVSSVENKDIVKAPVSDLQSSLGGRLPGLRVVSRSGEPGSKAEIDVRGFGAALIIVDGVPGDFSQLDPNEIENISVLKDASAAVYGVKAANGVILVTTKRGSKTDSAPRINVNSTFSWQRPTVFPKMVNAGQFTELTDEDRINRGQAPLYGADEVAKWKAGEAGYESTDWYKEVVRDYAPQQQYNMNITGGSKAISYFASVGYINQDGMWKSGSSNYNRFNVRSNVDAKITRNLTASLSMAGRKEKTTNPYDVYVDSGKDANTQNNTMIALYRNHPTFKPYADPDKKYPAVTNVAHQNPIVISDKDIMGYKKRDRKVFEGSLSLNYDFSDFVEGLSAKAMYHYRSLTTIDSEFRKEYNLYEYNPSTDTYDIKYVGNSPSQLKKKLADDNYKLFQGSINYNRVFAEKHDVAGLFLVETREGSDLWFDATREFIIDALDELQAGSKDNIANDGTSKSNGNIGYVGRVNYAYDNKYLFEFGFRYDGSSNFPANKRWGFFPSVSGGWRISQEKFLLNKVPILDDLKLRASWGRLGDDTFAETEHMNQYLVGYKYPEGSYIFGDKVIPGIETRGLANPDITWYTADLYNIGFDVTTFGGKLGAEIDVFYRKRKDLLARRTVSLPSTSGAALPLENLNTESDRGYELVLRHSNRLPNGIEYSIRGNMSYTKTKNEYIDRGASANMTENWRNNTNSRWKNIYWGYKSVGQFQSYDEIASAPIQDGKGNTTLRPGDIRYRDYNGDGVIDSSDEHVIGRGDKPEYMFGLDLYATWKGVDVSVFLQGATNFNVYYIDDITTPFFNGNSSFEAFYDRWHREDLYDANSKWVPGKYPSTYANGLENNRKKSSFWLQNANYLRIKDIQVGYTLPKGMVSKVGINKVRVFFSGYNLFTFTSLDLLDPEAPNDTKGGYYPQQKVISFGFNLTL